MMILWLCLITLAIQLISALIAIIGKTDKVTDLSYGGTFVVVGLWLLLTQGDGLVDIGLAVLVIVWGTRLAGYLFLRILSIGKDDRFDGIREEWRSFAKFWLLQASIIVLLMLPVLFAMQQESLAVHRLFVIGRFVAGAGIVIETLADRQKFTYKRQNPKHRVDIGLRAKSRHPNYLGELMMWRGAFLACLPYLSGRQYLSIIGPAGITIALLFITGIPPLEQRREEKYGDQKEFQDWKKRTRLLWVW